MISRYVVDPFDAGARSDPRNNLVDVDELLEDLLRRRAGNTGALVHNNPPRCAWHVACPFCGCRSWFSFLTGDEDTQGMDVFECLRCMATSTRLDHCGVDEWKKMMERDRARKARKS